GDDEIAKELTIMLQSIGVNIEGLVTQNGRKTSRKSRIIAAHQQILRYDNESKETISEASAEKIIKAIEKDLFVTDMIILSDYGKGVISDRLAQAVIHLAKERGIRVLVDPKGTDYSRYRGAHMLTPNKKEASEATGIRIVDDESLERALLALKEQCALERSMITLSEEGLAIYDGEVKRFPTVAQEVFDVTGAGDTVIASIAFALSAGLSIEETARFANLAAGVVVGKIGSATVTLDEIEIYESKLHQSSSDAHIKSFEEIDRVVKRAKEHGQRVVFTNGCFDILHVGHVKYLQEAKSFGDILIVGLNSDSSVRELKGPTRPINAEDDRAYILAALDAVDYVVKFSEETPYDLIKMIAPDVLVKGGDYEGKKVVGTEFAKVLKLVDFVNGKSTTKTIEKIQGSTC
ncbi:MAG: D-glycero-beta-D-manno-heptose 1-phosphate adenylyltransferase, partial [Thiovulaceae bacterium]|nr:D-glycero-beta-D-manno-heptose 1-phosphate adenylyltransferase [Sulfurimonadaceae bacterium]